jgi:phenylacetate-CoA ligase
VSSAEPALSVAAALRAGVAYAAAGPASVGLAGAIARARRSRFFANKLAAAGIADEGPIDWERWLAIPPTTKEELRAVGAPEHELWIVGREDVAEFWRSGGVTGRPLFYPRTAADVADSLDAFARCLAFAGVSAEDTFLCSLPIGVHPAGQQAVRAAERIGAATIWAGAGNQTPSLAQVDLVHDLGATVWCGMPSFGLHLAHLAEAAGRPLDRSAVRTLITTAEVLSNPKRSLLERLWGARVVDVFGMSEITLMGAECGRRPGLHVWKEVSFCEALDAQTLRPVAAGETGVLCVTPIAGGRALPFLRWLSGDLVRLEAGCECDEPSHPRLVHCGRTLGFFKVKGVNLNHAEVEDGLYQIPALVDFRVSVTPQERLLVELEGAEPLRAELGAAVEALFLARFGLSCDVAFVERGAIARSLEGQIKAQRFVDRRIGE